MVKLVLNFTFLFLIVQTFFEVDEAIVSIEIDKISVNFRLLLNPCSNSLRHYDSQRSNNKKLYPPSISNQSHSLEENLHQKRLHCILPDGYHRVETNLTGLLENELKPIPDFPTYIAHNIHKSNALMNTDSMTASIAQTIDPMMVPPLAFNQPSPRLKTLHGKKPRLPRHQILISILQLIGQN